MFRKSYPAHIFFSRMSIYNIVDPFFAMLALAFLARGMRHKSHLRYWVLAGIVAGVAQYFYHGSRLVLVLMAVYVGVSAIPSMVSHSSQQSAKKHKRFSLFDLLASWRLNIFWMAFAFGLVALPRYAPMILNRLPVTGNEQTMRLPADLGANSLRAALAWVGQKDASPFWLSDAPLLEWPALLAFGIGMAVCLWWWRNPRSMVLIASIVLTTIFGAAIWTAAPLYVRYMTAVPAIALLVALGIETIKSLTQRSRGTEIQRKTILFLQVAAIVVISGQGIWAAGIQPGEARERISAGYWEADALAQAAAKLPDGTAAVLAVSPYFGANLPERGELETLMIADYVAAYGERRTVVVSREDIPTLEQQFKYFTKPYQILSARNPH